MLSFESIVTDGYIPPDSSKVEKLHEVPWPAWAPLLLNLRNSAAQLRERGMFRYPRVYRACVTAVVLTTLLADTFIIATVVGQIYQEGCGAAHRRSAAPGVRACTQPARGQHRLGVFAGTRTRGYKLQLTSYKLQVTKVHVRVVLCDDGDAHVGLGRRSRGPPPRGDSLASPNQ